MSKTLVAATMAVITAAIATWSATVIIASPPKQNAVAPASTSIDVLQLMRDAKDLPEQQFDAI